MELLLFTKNTRLEMTPNTLEDIYAWPMEKKLQELEYMANTIPSSWEFVHYVFNVTGVSRAYTHQQVRTRSASYAQQSLRVVNVNEFDYIFTDRNQSNLQAMSLITGVLDHIKDVYRRLIIECGQPVEDARGVLPTNIATNIVCRFDLRSFAELARSRTGGRTQGEYQKVVNAMVDEVLTVHPWAEKFIFRKPRHHFDEIEAFAEREFGGNLLKKGELLKIVDALRKGE